MAKETAACTADHGLEDVRAGRVISNGEMGWPNQRMEKTRWPHVVNGNSPVGLKVHSTPARKDFLSLGSHMQNRSGRLHGDGHMPLFFFTAL